MAEAITVARPYAEALYKLSLKNKNLSQWSKMLQFAAKIAEDKRIKMLIDNPRVSAEQISKLFFDIGKSNFDNEAHNFLTLLAENKRITILPQISQLYEQLKAQYEGILEAKITSAFEIDAKQLKKLIDDLEQKFNCKIEPKVSIDPELIGGIKVEIGDEVFDASVRGKLEAMTVALKS
ncbi:ATP synthase F1 subcomplex delta subunit [Nitrosomonas sp. PY1]|uniref:F0F1 ATP synthase subunit delta n=1 Tax=Nitrosomonas sp. PY1 TaxID=1803906 RepID=UPI001FC7DBB6|nr:F0F1 ATP synthase subunit delta [Nitrosomonas sp. PY1]GKS70124.1 ATP synthase F1 subcomplex delta subunit [Nitrosomonas sp. PY1]